MKRRDFLKIAMAASVVGLVPKATAEWEQPNKLHGVPLKYRGTLDCEVRASYIEIILAQIQTFKTDPNNDAIWLKPDFFENVKKEAFSRAEWVNGYGQIKFPQYSTRCLIYKDRIFIGGYRVLKLT